MNSHETAAPWSNALRGHRLPGRSLIRTAWLDDLGKILAQEAEPKRLSFVARADRAPSELTLLVLPRSRFYGVTHGGAVCCLTAELNCFEFIFVMQGTLFTGAATMQQRVTAGEAVLHFPGGRHCACWEPDSSAIVLRIEPEVLSSFGYYPQRIAQRGRDGRVCRFSLGSGLGKTLFGMCGQICEEAEGSPAVPEQARQEDLLFYAVELIIEALTDSTAASRGRRPVPPYLKSTVDYILANLERDTDARTLASVSGVSIRTLQQAFAREFGKGPLTFVKHTRLQRIREELLRADPWETTVTDVATRWGVTHLSNFSHNYAAMFGESPSQTLRKARRGFS